MKFRSGLLALASFFSIAMITLPSLPALAAANAQEFRLANGLRIIVQEDKRAPTVTHMIWYRVGSMDEQSGTTGVAHVLEHMMFKGTQKLKPGDFSAKVAALGGRDNAFTGKDYTAYHQQIEKSHLAEVMALEAAVQSERRDGPLSLTQGCADVFYILSTQHTRHVRTKEAVGCAKSRHTPKLAIQAKPSFLAC